MLQACEKHRITWKRSLLGPANTRIEWTAESAALNRKPLGRLTKDMTTEAAVYKFGKIENGLDMEYRYANLWDIEQTRGPSRLLLAPVADQVSLVSDLLNDLPEPFGILYVLLLSRRGHEPGRYQSPYPTDTSETRRFLEEYREFLERDARHHLRVMSLAAEGTIVYDNHNVIYAYGSLQKFEQVAHKHALKRGDVRFPVPHTHKYNAAYDDEEDKILSHWSWKMFPLQESDD